MLFYSDTDMKNRFRLYRNGVFYAQDSCAGKQESLRTVKRSEAEQLLHARNTAVQQPLLNLELAKAYLTAADPKMAERTWRDVMREYATHGRDRCVRVRGTRKVPDAYRAYLFLCTDRSEKSREIHAARGGQRLVVQPDGKILIGGDFTTLSCQPTISVTKAREWKGCVCHPAKTCPGDIAAH